MELNQATVARYLSDQCGTPVSVLGVSEFGQRMTGAAALKAFGYGRPVLVRYQAVGDEANEPQQVVLRQVNRNGYGHERDDDRVAEIWLDYATFNLLPKHVCARDIVGLADDGVLVSLGRVQEVMLITEYAEGRPYANDLLRMLEQGACTARDVQQAEALASYLAKIHATKHDDPLLWRRRLRDLVGDGEGIMGLTDSYPQDGSVVPLSELRAIEMAANEYRWRLKPRVSRLCQVHGDFHPFNILLTNNQDFVVLDRSRGAWGEPADDVSCLSINYLFFSLQRYGRLAGPFEQLYLAFWKRYLAERPDDELASVIAPWYAWRTLVLASPQWYPTITAEVRHQLLTFARTILALDTYQWQNVNTYFERS